MRSRPASSREACARQFLELRSPDGRGFGLVHEIEQAAAHAAQRGDLVFARAHRLGKTLELQLARARSSAASRIRHAQSDRAHGRAMHGVIGMREPLRLAVHDDVDVALPPARHRLADVSVRLRKTEREQHLVELLRFFLAGAELDELDSLAGDARVLRPPDLLEQIVEGTHAIERDFRGRTGAKSVVENLQRQHAVIADALQRADELEQTAGRPARACSESGGSTTADPWRASGHRRSAHERAFPRGSTFRLSMGIPGASELKASSASPTAG